MTHGLTVVSIALAASLMAVLMVGFFAGWVNTWPVVVLVLGGAYLLGRQHA